MSNTANASLNYKNIRMKKLKHILLVGLVSIPLIMSAQQDKEFTADAQIRARGEYRNGALFPRYEGQEAAGFINNRTRLSLGYKQYNANSNLELKLSGQHVGVWGQEAQINKNGDFILNEAWAKLNFNNGFFAQLGRQALSYDDERILGGLDWNVAGRYHDLLKVGYSNGLNTLHAAFAFNQNDEKINGGSYYAPGAQPYKNMQMLWYHYGTNEKPFGVSLLAMNLGWEMGELTKAKHAFMQTLGTYMTYKESIWDVNGSFYYQTGKSKADQSVSAFMASAFAKAHVNSAWAVGVGSDFLSGGKQTDSKHRAFDPLYGTHHKFYGAMDYFYASAFVNGYNPGLWDNQLGVYYKASPKVDMSLNYHYFRTAKGIQMSANEKGKSLGSELDFQVNWFIMPDVKLMAGYSFMVGNNRMDVVKGGNHKSWQDWGWVSLNITPRLFSTK